MAALRTIDPLADQIVGNQKAVLTTDVLTRLFIELQDMIAKYFNGHALHYKRFTTSSQHNKP